MAKGFDTATRITADKARLFAAQGFVFAGRYLDNPTSWKALSATETREISEAGLYIVSLYERTANRSREGAAAGQTDGRQALAHAKQVGQPEGSAIYTAVDYDAQPMDYDRIEAYMRAFDAEIEGYELGIYGSYAVCKGMYERGITQKLMQTYAWSRGQVFPQNSIYQYENDISVNGIGIDRCESNGDAGGWRVGMAIKPAAPQLDKEVAANIIDSFLKKYWAECEAERAQAEREGRAADAEAWKGLRDWQHHLANELRAASGLQAE
ncbi:MAG: hypothetical protein K0Q90_327 [Paenibacillaceae bacterium]|jgi:hypothetical protein|nr:hypothetical protein [Paenibacillaceae bacterium]